MRGRMYTMNQASKIYSQGHAGTYTLRRSNRNSLVIQILHSLIHPNLSSNSRRFYNLAKYLSKVLCLCQKFYLAVRSIADPLRPVREIVDHQRSLLERLLGKRLSSGCPDHGRFAEIIIGKEGVKSF